MNDREESILSNYIKQGWALSGNECPLCGSPLLRKGSVLFCAICNREVRIAENMEEYLKYLEENIRNELREKVIRTIGLIIKDKDVLDEDIVKTIESYIRLLKELKNL